MPGAFPALKGDPVVNDADPSKHIHVVVFGLEGATIDGVKYDAAMPEFGSQLSDADIAGIINYERSSWGNHGKLGDRAGRGGRAGQRQVERRYVMDHHMTGPLLGNLVIIAISGAITIGCFAAMFWMLLRPGETDRRHPKYDILRDDH